MVSDSFFIGVPDTEINVLILVVMEYGLGRCTMTMTKTKKSIVLILVVMEYGLCADISRVVQFTKSYLNPCFSGRWSLTGIWTGGMR